MEELKRTSGVLCDKKISARMKGRMYKTVLRPALLLMRMLRGMCGVTRADRIQNERVRSTVNVMEVSAKGQERRLQ